MLKRNPLPAIGLLLTPLVANFSDAEEGLPPVRQLIAETLALCKADLENNSEALDTLAEAQCCLGDFATARKTLSSPGSANFRVAHLHCAQIEIELTGSIPSIPDSLWKYDGGVMRCKAALAFIQRGEIEKVLEQIDQIPKLANSALNGFGVELIQKIKEREAKEASRKIALAWASRLGQADSITVFRYHYQVPQLVVWLVEFNERPAASQFVSVGNPF
jgi:hypothetical protein